MSDTPDTPAACLLVSVRFLDADGQPVTHQFTEEAARAFWQDLKAVFGGVPDLTVSLYLTGSAGCPQKTVRVRTAEAKQLAFTLAATLQRIGGGK